MKAIIEVGLDFGASRIKVSFYNKKVVEDFYFPNRVSEGEIVTDGVKVIIDGKSVVVGTIGGQSNSINKKINYKNLAQIVLTVAYEIKKRLELLEDTINLQINTVLPPKEFKESREEFKALIKEVSGTKAIVEGEELTVIIDDVKVGAEGVALLGVCDIENSSDKLTQVLLLDIGSSTTDIVILSKNDTIWSIKDATTSYIAGRKFCEAIETKLNAGTGCSFEWFDLEREQSYQLDGEMHKLIKQISGTDKVVQELIKELDLIGNIRQYKVILAGAGSRLLKESEVFKAYTKFSCIDDSLLDYGNSRGALKA